MVSSMGQQVEHRNQSSWNEPFCNEKSFQNIEQIVTDTSQIGRQKDNIKKEKNVSRIMDKKLNSPKKKGNRPEPLNLQEVNKPAGGRHAIITPGSGGKDMNGQYLEIPPLVFSPTNYNMLSNLSAGSKQFNPFSPAVGGNPGGQPGTPSFIDPTVLYSPNTPYNLFSPSMHGATTPWIRSPRAFTFDFDDTNTPQISPITPQGYSKFQQAYVAQQQQQLQEENDSQLNNKQKPIPAGYKRKRNEIGNTQQPGKMKKNESPNHQQSSEGSLMSPINNSPFLNRMQIQQQYSTLAALEQQQQLNTLAAAAANQSLNNHLWNVLSQNGSTPRHHHQQQQFTNVPYYDEARKKLHNVQQQKYNIKEEKLINIEGREEDDPRMRLAPGATKIAGKRWTSKQDAQLRAAVKKHAASNWKLIAEDVEDRTHVQCLQRWKKVLQPGLIKGIWSKEEDALLLRLIKENGGARCWTRIATKIDGRTAKQCRERWNLNLDPSINREAWSEEEDQLLLTMHENIGNKWAEIKRALPGRTENGVKSRFKSLQRAKKKKEKQQQTKW